MRFLLPLLLAASASPASLGPVPAGLPTTLQIGLQDGPGGAAAMAACAPFGYRFQYLSGGANRTNWSSWNANADFPTYYIQDSAAHGIVPDFDYYMLLQSNPATGASEGDKDYSNLNNVATMQAYYANFKLLMQKCAPFSSPIIVHVEPDCWGYMEGRATGDNAATVSAAVGSAGGDAAGYPNTVAGFAQALAHIRDTYAPQVLLAYHASMWGTGTDLLYSDPSDAQCTALGQKSAAFYNSLSASFDLIFFDFLDRDAAWYGAHGSPWKWYDDGDYHRHVLWCSALATGTGKRLIAWQVPIGNTRMRACANTTGHLQSNQVEWLFDDAGSAHLQAYIDAGLIGVIFGIGDASCSTAHDSQGDGVTNPTPIAPSLGSPATWQNTIVSALASAGTAPSYDGATLTTPYAADDDGGYLRWRAYVYYHGGPVSTPGGATGGSASGGISSGGSGGGSADAGSGSRCGLGGFAIGLTALALLARRRRTAA